MLYLPYLNDKNKSYYDFNIAFFRHYGLSNLDTNMITKIICAIEANRKVETEFRRYHHIKLCVIVELSEYHFTRVYSIM